MRVQTRGLDVTWRIDDNTKIYAERQAQLFFLTFKCTLWAQKKKSYTAKFNQTEVIREVLNYALEEKHPPSTKKCTRSQDRQARPFTFVLTSARGKQCDEVWKVVYQVCQIIPHSTFDVATYHLDKASTGREGTRPSGSLPSYPN